MGVPCGDSYASRVVAVQNSLLPTAARSLWLALVVGFFAVGVYVCWSSMAFFALPVMLLPTAVFACGLDLVLRWILHLTSTRQLKGRSALMIAFSWFVVLGLAWLLPSLAFLALRGPRVAVLWPLDSLFMLIEDPDWPPKFDWPSRDRWRWIKSGIGRGYDNEQALRALDELMNDHPEYYNLYFERAALLLAEGRIDEAVACFDRGVEVRSGGFYLPHDSDWPMPVSVEHQWFASHLDNVGERELAAEYRSRAEREGER